jgi:hypothetical protein
MTRILERWLFAAVTLAFAAVLWTPPVVAQEEEEEEQAEAPQDRPTLLAHPLTGSIRLDGLLSEGDWEDAESIGGLITIEPEEGGTPAGRTEVKVLVSSKEIYVGVAAYDNDVSGIVSYSMARDIELDEEDHVVLIFDTFRDGRSGYAFAINPAGSRFDGLIIEQGEDVNSNWDAIWEAATFQDANGWYAEIRIPVNSLGFRPGLDSWGFNVERRVQRLQETSRWSAVDIDYEIFQTSQAGLLNGLPEFDLGVGLTITPSLVGRTFRETQEDREWEGEPSLDLTQKLGSNLLAALTVNTDFAETEVDVRQINLTRFPLYFPEKRAFFLEGADIFEFAQGLDEDNLIPFNSRRIGLVGLGEGDQLEVPINAGGKIHGRVGNTNVGALVVNTRAVDGLELDEDSVVDVPNTTMSAFRLSQNILDESSIGVLATYGDQAGRKESWSAGADFNYRTSEFGDEKNLAIGFWGMMTDRDDLKDLEGDKYAFGGRIDYPNDLFDFTLTSIRIGKLFDPSLSFVPRRGVHIWSFGGGYNPRPSWSLVRRMTHEVDLTVYQSTEDLGSWESYAAEIIPLDWQLESGDRFSAELILEGDRPPEEFEIADDVNVAAGDYEWSRYAVSLRGAEKRALSGEVRYEWGDYYNGNLTTVEASTIFRPSALLTVEFAAERNTGEALVESEDGAGFEVTDFIEQVYSARILLNLSPNLQLGTLTQYDTESRELGSNNKLRWTFSPNGDLFIVYNHNVIRSDDRRWLFESNQLPVKIQYSWRF